MSNKNKTVSFRIKEDSFERLRGIAEERDLSLSALFRDYVDALVAHDGQVEVVPEHQVREIDAEDANEDEFPPTVEVSKSFVREHERLELEAEHLREQLEEHKRYITRLRERVDEADEDEVIQLEEIDGELNDDEPFQLG